MYDYPNPHLQVQPIPNRAIIVISHAWHVGPWYGLPLWCLLFDIKEFIRSTLVPMTLSDLQSRHLDDSMSVR